MLSPSYKAVHFALRVTMFRDPYQNNGVQNNG
jgi:hypothetical protein